jgi:hypothetical protein
VGLCVSPATNPRRFKAPIRRGYDWEKPDTISRRAALANKKPRQGRKHVAHGVSRGIKDAPSPPTPSPARVGAVAPVYDRRALQPLISPLTERRYSYPRVHALGHILPALRAWDAQVPPT